VNREFTVIIERDARGYYVASVPTLRGCYSQADSLDELITRIKEAIELCIEVQGEAGDALAFVGVQRVRLPGPHPLVPGHSALWSVVRRALYAATTTDSCPCAFRVGVTRTSPSWPRAVRKSINRSTE